MCIHFILNNIIYFYHMNGIDWDLKFKGCFDYFYDNTYFFKVLGKKIS